MIIKTFISSIVFSFMWASTAMAISLVEAEWLQSNMQDASIRIADVSNKPDTYAKGHIPGAVAVYRKTDLGDLNAYPPNRYPTKEQYELLMQRLGIGNDTVVVAYDDTLGLFASRLLVIMEYYGHDLDKLKLLNGGTVRWQQLGYAMTKEPFVPEEAKYSAQEGNDSLRISWSDIYGDVVQGARPEVMLLDARPRAEHEGQKIRAIRAGFIPRAINVTGADAVDPKDHRFKSVAEIQKMYTEKGLTKEKTIYEYCHSGDRSAHAYFQLKHMLGYENVRFYDGGWREWAALLALPAEGQVWLWQVMK